MFLQQPDTILTVLDDEFVLIFDNVPIGTSGSPTDRATANIPSNVNGYRPYAALARTVSANGTLAIGTLSIYSAAAAGGTNIIAPIALTGLTAADTVQDLTIISLASVLTAPTLYLRQTVNSLNAGVVRLHLYCRKIN
jgi:hypothetical protein